MMHNERQKVYGLTTETSLLVKIFFWEGGGGNIAAQKIFAGEDGRDRERERV